VGVNHGHIYGMVDAVVRGGGELVSFHAREPELLFMADARGVRYVDCSKLELPFGRQLVDDVLNRTETAMTQAHCLLAAELALVAQDKARVVS
jgi:hypothetical protein